MHFLVSLFIAIIIWLFKSLSASYNSEIPVELLYEFPEKSTALNPLPDHAVVYVTTTGWQLLREKLYKRQVTLSYNQFEENNLITNNYPELFSSDLPAAFTVVHISPDTIQFNLEGFVTKKIPVRLDEKIVFSSGFSLSDTIVLTPDSIFISGPRSIVDSVFEWETEQLQILNVQNTVTGAIPLKTSHHQNLILSAVAVAYVLPVAKMDTTRPDSSFINLQRK